MSQSFHHSGGSLPITLGLDEIEIDAACPTCERMGEAGRATAKVDVDRMEGMTPVTCASGHMTLITWSRSASPSAPSGS